MKIKPLFWVVIPLATVTVVSLLLHTYWQADGFFLNLATEFIGIVATVWYVDWIIRSHENESWKPLDARIADRLRATLNATVRSIGTPLGVTIDDLPIDHFSTDVVAIHKQLISHASNELSPSCKARVLRVDAAGWKAFYSQIFHANETVHTFQSTFKDRLTPQQNSDLLDLEEHLASSMMAYTIFPDVMGRPASELPKTKTPGDVLQREWCELSAKSLRLAIASVKSLSDSLSDEVTATSRK